jgi:hypothetical protein
MTDLELDRSFEVCGPVECPRDGCQHVHMGAVTITPSRVQIAFGCEWCCSAWVMSISYYHGQSAIVLHDTHGDSTCGPNCDHYPSQGRRT